MTKMENELLDSHRWGWTDERRARQSALIHGWKPWLASTGAQTDEGRKRSAKNAALKPGSLRYYLREVNNHCREHRRIVREIERLKRILPKQQVNR